MKKSNLAIYITLILVIIGVILQLMEAGLFGENPIPKITEYNQILFWAGIAIWAIGYVGKEPWQKKESRNGRTKVNPKKINRNT